MNRFTSLVIAAAFLAVAGQAQAIIIADARGDFVAGTSIGDPGILPAAGTGTWNYLASDTVNPTLDAVLDGLTWNGSTYIDFTSGGSANAVDLLSASLASDEIRVHPSASSRPPPFVVTRWVAGPGESGLINIAGNVRKIDAGGGDGVTFELFVDGISLFSSTLAFNDLVGAAFSQTLTVGVGSTVDFVVGSNGFDANDSTGLKATISAIPEPSTFAIFAFGAALLGFAMRRRGKALAA